MKTRILLSLAGLLAVIGTYVMTTATDTHAARGDSTATATVTLDVYSGKPNPSWQLSATHTAELELRLRALQPTTQEVKEFDGLGYRAVSVVIVRSEAARVEVTASRGMVTIRESGQTRRYTDTGSGLEAWLANTGADTVSPELLKQVNASIKSAAR